MKSERMTIGETADDLFSRPLKSVEVSQLEVVIAKAISGLVNAEYEATINQLDFDPESHPNGWMSDTVELRLTVRQPMSLELFAAKSNEKPNLE